MSWSSEKLKQHQYHQPDKPKVTEIRPNKIRDGRGDMTEDYQGIFLKNVYLTNWKNLEEMNTFPDNNKNTLVLYIAVGNILVKVLLL